MGLIEQISGTRLVALNRMRNEQAEQRFPATMPAGFFPSQRWIAEHQSVSELVGRIVPRVLNEVGISPIEYFLRREYGRERDLRQVFHIIDLGHPSDWDLVRSPDSYEMRLLHEINLGTSTSIVRLRGGQEFESTLFREFHLREYIIARLSDPRIVLPG